MHKAGTSGKTHVTIKFAAREGRKVAQVAGLRVVRRSLAGAA
ncbi:hypothetical protein [Paenibacillus caseinilyticus]|nr:hypothetical protein [Paenibacillus caseinilyticus]MCZ8520958.1 hypothetical protein [Paenibacillus caseinilyticus]